MHSVSIFFWVKIFWAKHKVTKGQKKKTGTQTKKKKILRRGSWIIAIKQLTAEIKEERIH